MEIIAALLFIGLFAWLSAMCGGTWPKLPWGLDQHIYAIPYAILAFILMAEYPLWAAMTCAAMSYATAFIFKRTGHGTYMTLPYSLKAVEPERLDFIVKYVFGRDPRFVPKEFPIEVLATQIMKYGEKKLMHRNLFGLFVTGIGVGLGAAITSIISGFPIIAILLLVSAGAKTLAYYLGYKFRKDGSERTKIGEILTGLFAGIGLAIAALIIRKKKD